MPGRDVEFSSKILGSDVQGQSRQAPKAPVSHLVLNIDVLLGKDMIRECYRGLSAFISFRDRLRFG